MSRTGKAMYTILKTIIISAALLLGWLALLPINIVMGTLVGMLFSVETFTAVRLIVMMFSIASLMGAVLIYKNSVRRQPKEALGYKS